MRDREIMRPQRGNIAGIIDCRHCPRSGATIVIIHNHMQISCAGFPLYPYFIVFSGDALAGYMIHGRRPSGDHIGRVAYPGVVNHAIRAARILELNLQISLRWNILLECNQRAEPLARRRQRWRSAGPA